MVGGYCRCVAEPAERLACEHLPAEGHLVGGAVSPLAGCAAGAVVSVLIAPGLAGWCECRASG